MVGVECPIDRKEMKKASRCLVLFLVCLLAANHITAKEYQIHSPNNEIQISVHTDDGIKWSARVAGHPIFKNNRVRMILDNEVLGENASVKDVRENSVSELVETIIAVKSRTIVNEFNELSLQFEDDYSVIFRVYDNGMAYRFETSKKGEITIDGELVELNFCDDYPMLFPEETSMQSNYEPLYLEDHLSAFEEGRFCSLPMLVKASGNIKIGITEANLLDYPGLFLQTTGTPQLKGKFPREVLDFEYKEPHGMKNMVRADYIARTEGTRSFPWRVFMISQTDEELVENQMVYLLSDECKIEDTSWIKPGLVSWEWWNDTGLYGVDFKPGLNTETYKYYIDFASRYEIPYIILDGGWSKSVDNIMEPRPEIDIVELVRYGKERNVGLILWSAWNAIDKHREVALDQFEEWGIKGVKVDFMVLSNQYMVNFYERTAKACAERKLILDFHGSFKPVGLQRAYPNILNYEGVKGLETCKWSDVITPEHNVTIPFTRMLAGTMDYTPGSFRNAHEEDYAISRSRPMSLGTRCHQLAMYVVYDAALQMLADSPSNYYREEECTRFLSKMNTVWDTTNVLKAKVGDYIVTARRSGDDWYIGAMTDHEARNLSIDLSFLDEGDYAIEIMKDGTNASQIAIDYQRIVTSVDRNTTLDISMAPGGGWAAICTKK